MATLSLGKRRRMSSLQRRNAMYGYIAILPWLLGFLIFTAGPMVYSAYLAFTDWELLTPPEWVGFRNFEKLQRDPMFRTAMTNTIIYTVFSVPLQLLIAFGVALLLNQNIRGKNIYRAIAFLPSQMPAVATALLWFFIFSPTQGLANAGLDVVGISPQKWLWDVDLVKPTLIAIAIWGFGGAMIIFLAGLQDIPETLYEAAAIDGAGSWSRLRNITIPLLTPTIFFNLVIGLIASFQVFTPVFLMTGGGPGTSSTMMGLMIYREGFEEFQMGYASLLAWVLFMVVIVLTIIQFTIARKWVHYEGERA